MLIVTNINISYKYFILNPTKNFDPTFITLQRYTCSLFPQYGY